MNYRTLFLFLCLASMRSVYCVYGKNFFMFKPSFEFNDPERRVTLDRDDKKVLLDITVFGGKICQSQEWATYFLPVDKSCIRITEDGSPNFHGTDVTAGFMDIVTVPLRDKTARGIQDEIGNMTYDSVVNFCPKCTEVGVGLVFKYQLPEQCWFSLATSVVQVRNKLNIYENIFNVGGAGPDSGFGYKSLYAFINSDCSTWNYGKFYNGCIKKTGVPEIEITLGHDHEHADVGKSSGFLGLIIPTGSTVCQKYLFAPLIGNGKHVGLFGGVQGEYTLAQGNDITISLVPSGLIRYLAPRQEQRSFDLKGRPWSRYMWVWLNNDALGDPAVGTNVASALQRMVPLVNYSTLCVDVNPNWSVDVNLGLQFERERTKFELGYHGYAREAEDICFCGANMADGLGLQAFTGYLNKWEDNDHLPVTRSFDSINAPVFSANSSLADYASYTAGLTNATYIPVTLDSLDLDSARTPAAFAQTIYVLLSHQFDTKKIPVALRVGGSYTFASNNSYPCGWKAWGALTFAF